MDNMIPENGNQFPQQPVQQIPAQPAYQAPPQPVFQQPVYQTPPQPVYQQPVYQTPPQPVYQQPAYQAPPQPVQQQPVYQTPTQPMQQPPVQQAPQQAKPLPVFIPAPQATNIQPPQMLHNQQRRIPVISLMMVTILGYQCVSSILNTWLRHVLFVGFGIDELISLIYYASKATGLGLMIAGIFRYKDGKAILFGIGVFTYAGAYLYMTTYEDFQVVNLLIITLRSCLMIAVGVCYFVRKTHFPTTWKTVFCIVMLSLAVAQSPIVYVDYTSHKDGLAYYFMSDEEYALSTIWWALDDAIAPVCFLMFTPAKEQKV